LSSGATNTISSSYQYLVSGSWMHVALTMNNAVLNYFSNGQIQYSSTVSYVIERMVRASMFLGGYPGRCSGYCIYGYMDELRFFSKYLTMS
jgi:hypothetical protein